MSSRWGLSFMATLTCASLLAGCRHQDEPPTEGSLEVAPPMAGQEAGTDSSAGVLVERNIRIPMSNDVTLAADIIRPEQAEFVPTLVIISPYSRTPIQARAAAWAGRGYALVFVDSRGTFDSGGELPLRQRGQGRVRCPAMDWTAAVVRRQSGDVGQVLSCLHRTPLGPFWEPTSSSPHPGLIAIGQLLSGVVFGRASPPGPCLPRCSGSGWAAGYDRS